MAHNSFYFYAVLYYEYVESTKGSYNGSYFLNTDEDYHIYLFYYLKIHN